MATRESTAPAVAYSEVPAMIAGSVNLMRFSEALAQAGIVGRYDPDRGVLLIQPAPERCRACGGSGLDDDARCEFCDGRAELPQQATQEPRPDAWLGMRWYNGLTRLERAQWHQRAGSAVPADAWRAYQREAHP